MFKEFLKSINPLTVSILMTAITAFIVSKTFSEPWADHAMTTCGMFVAWFLFAMAFGWGHPKDTKTTVSDDLEEDITRVKL